MKALKDEIELLKQGIRHPNIVQYYGCYDNGEVFSILMEYMPGVGGWVEGGLGGWVEGGLGGWVGGGLNEMEAGWWVK